MEYSVRLESDFGYSSNRVRIPLSKVAILDTDDRKTLFRRLTTSSHTMYQFNGVKKSPRPQNRQPVVLITKSKQEADDFVGELTFSNHLVNTLSDETRLFRVRASHETLIPNPAP